jgi:heme/copper-type cytochrome/quinol oxidase subunit 2
VLLRVFRRYGDLFAVIASSLVWALLHGNFVQGIPVFFMGIFFGILALEADSIIPTFIIHAVNNTIAMAESSAQNGSMIFKASIGMVNFTIMLLAAVLFSLFYKKFRIEQKGSPATGFKAFFSSIPIIIVIIFCAVLTVLSVKPL